MAQSRLDSGEELLVASLGQASPLAQSALACDPFPVPYEQLAGIDGWIVWLGHSPVPAGLPLLPAPEHLLRDAPGDALAAAAMVATDYAARRGARDPEALIAILRRESPVAIIVPDEVHPSLQPPLAELRSIGVPVAAGRFDRDRLLCAIDPFALRHKTHPAPVGRAHDPALSFQEVAVVDRIGGNSLSSFVLHNKGERDAVTVIGKFGPHVGIEIGILAPNLSIAATDPIEHDAALYPSFLTGVTSRVEGHSLEIGWRAGAPPSPSAIGEVFRSWLKSLHGATLVDVRIAFAPPRGRSALLTDMSARARAFKRVREAAIAGDSDPSAAAIEREVES